MRVSDFRIKGMGESFADIALDVIPVSAGDAQIVTVRKGRGDDDFVLRPSVIPSMLVHMVKIGLEYEFVRGASTFVQRGASVKAAAGRQVLFHKVADGMTVLCCPFVVPSLVATGGGFNERGEAGVEFHFHNRKDEG